MAIKQIRAFRTTLLTAATASCTLTCFVYLFYPTAPGHLLVSGNAFNNKHDLMWKNTTKLQAYSRNITDCTKAVVVHIVNESPELFQDARTVLKTIKHFVTNNLCNVDTKSGNVNEIRRYKGELGRRPLCHDGVTLVVLVCSRHRNYENRRAIRETWAFRDSLPVGVLILFLIGHHGGEKWNKIALKEAEIHGDVLVVDEPDTYRGLGVKVLKGLQWVIKSCSLDVTVVKSDDDVFLNIPALYAASNSGYYRRSGITGALSNFSLVSREITDKWFVSVTQYPFPVFPPYITGGSYAMSRNTAKRIVHASRRCQSFPLEDVYISGFLALAAGVDLFPHPGYSYWMSQSPSSCDIITGKRINGANMLPSEIIDLYKNISHLSAKKRVDCWFVK